MEQFRAQEIEPPEKESPLPLAQFLAEREVSSIQLESGETLYAFYHAQKLPVELPPGYCFVGGTARSIYCLERSIACPPPRDVDVVGISDFAADPQKATELSALIMPDDFAHGHGIKQDNLGSYFETRDFTINQILVDKSRIFITETALRDFETQVIRPTLASEADWYSNEEDERGISPKLVMKALRLQLEFEENDQPMNLEGIADWQWKLENIPLFFLALGLDRAYQRGDALATRFFTRLLRYGTIAPYANQDTLGGNSPEQLALSINYQMKEIGANPFVFSKEELNRLPSYGLNINDEMAVFDHYNHLASTFAGPGSKDIDPLQFK